MTDEAGIDDCDSKLNHVAKAILDLLRLHPEGLDIDQLKETLDVGADQMHLDRRLRSLRKYYDVPGAFEGGRYVYKLGARKTGVTDSGVISGRLRAEALNLAKGRCQMCGKTVAEDGVKLQVDHKVPQAWGGLTVIENLWAICGDCNNGKRDHFQSYDPDEMAELLAYEFVHERIAHLLKLHMGKPVDFERDRVRGERHGATGGLAEAPTRPALPGHRLGDYERAIPDAAGLHPQHLHPPQLAGPPTQPPAANPGLGEPRQEGAAQATARDRLTLIAFLSSVATAAATGGGKALPTCR